MTERDDRQQTTIEEDPPKPGDNFGGFTICATDACKYITRNIAGDPANLLFFCEEIGDLCAAPCGCRLFSWRKDRRWWDSDGDIVDHGTAAAGVKLPLDFERTRNVISLCVKPA